MDLFFASTNKSPIHKSFSQRGRIWVMRPHDINYPIKNSQASTNRLIFAPICRFSVTFLLARDPFGTARIRRPSEKDFLRSKSAEVVFVFSAKWLIFSLHSYVFVCVYSLFARLQKKLSRTPEYTMANFPTRSIMTKTANTTKNTIMKPSSERKRNRSISWLQRNPRNGLGKMKLFKFALMFVFS